MDPTAPIRAADRVQRGHPWLAIPVAVVKRFGDCGAGGLAASIAYYGFFSLFPLLLVLSSALGLVLDGRSDLQTRVLDSAMAQFPVVGGQIRQNVGSIEGSWFAVGLGLALALWAGLGGIRAAQVAMDTVWDVPRRRRRGTPASIALALVMLFVLGGFVLLGAVVAGVASAGGGAIAFVMSLALNVGTFLLAYRVLTAAEVSWRQVLPGAILAGIGWTALLALGGWLMADRIASSSRTYGTFAVVIGLLGWIYLGAQMTLFGAVLNVVLSHRLWPRSLLGTLTPADRRALRRSAEQEERIAEETVEVSFDERGRADEARSPGT